MQILNKTIFFVGAGSETVPGIIKAKEMGLVVCACDLNPQAPGFKYCDQSIIANAYDADDVLIQIKKSSLKKIDGVIALGLDAPSVVAAIANYFGVRSISAESALLATDKLKMKKRLKEQNVAIPWFSELESVEHLLEITKERGRRFIIKPVDSRGARGVLQIEKVDDLAAAYRTSLSFSPTKKVMLEELIRGPQISSESLFSNGRWVTIGYSDRNYEHWDKFAPHIIEDGGDLPSQYLGKFKTQIDQLVDKGAKALGLNFGSVKGDLVIDESTNEVKIIELAARLSGGFFCTHQIPLSTGFDFVKAAIQISLGESVQIDEDQLQAQPVCQRFLFLPPGRIAKIKPTQKIEQMPGVSLFELRISEGQIIQDVTNHTGRPGVVITTGDNRMQAQANARQALKSVEVSFD